MIKSQGEFINLNAPITNNKIHTPKDVSGFLNRSLKIPYIEFVYKFDFDDNGAIYYLGTRGKTRPFNNPHISG